jgi:hypothetical protein
LLSFPGFNYLINLLSFPGFNYLINLLSFPGADCDCDLHICHAIII